MQCDLVTGFALVLRCNLYRLIVCTLWSDLLRFRAAPCTSDENY